MIASATTASGRKEPTAIGSGSSSFMPSGVALIAISADASGLPMEISIALKGRNLLPSSSGFFASMSERARAPTFRSSSAKAIAACAATAHESATRSVQCMTSRFHAASKAFSIEEVAFPTARTGAKRVYDARYPYALGGRFEHARRSGLVRRRDDQARHVFDGAQTRQRLRDAARLHKHRRHMSIDASLLKEAIEDLRRSHLGDGLADIANSFVIDVRPQPPAGVHMRRGPSLSEIDLVSTNSSRPSRPARAQSSRQYS